MRLFCRKPTLFCLFTILTLTVGCTQKEYVRHLASEACLITPQQTTKKDINAYFGTPDKKQNLGNGREEWTYFQQNKSLLRKTPYLGEKLGSEQYDVMVIVFQGEIVDSCQYRMFTETEFKESHIETGPKPDAD